MAANAEALRELALALLNEVEALDDVPKVTAESGINLTDEVRRFEIKLIRRALRQTGGNQRRASRLLDIKPTTLNAKIKLYNINPLDT